MNKTLLLLMGLVLGAFLQACGPDEVVEPAKTVNKALLYDKKWYLDGNWAHTFYSDGKYSVDGTWRWLNDSDSMEIIEPGLGTYVYYFDYITKTEMKAGTRSSRSIFTTTP
jgi:hypothetical protein